MKWGQIGRDAWLSLLKHKLRSILSMLGIVFGVIAVVAMLAIAEGAKRETMGLIESLGTNNIIVRQLELTEAQKRTAQESLSRGLELSDVASLKRTIPILSNIAAVKEIQATVSASAIKDPLEILAVTAEFQQINRLVVQQGRFICNTDISQGNLVCVLGSELGRFLNNNGRLGTALRLDDRVYQVVGILRERRWIRNHSTALSVRNYNRMVFIPLGTEPMTASHWRIFGDISEIWLQVSRKTSVSACALAVRRILTRKHGHIEDFQVIVPQELLNQAKKIQRVFNIILGCIAGISLLVGGIGIMNTMLASVAERTREIGIRRSVGAARKHIVVQFLCESIALTTIGGCIGIVLGIGGAFAVSKFAGWKTMVTLWSMTVSLGMAGSVGLVSGLYPAIKAARLDPVNALRQE